ncbi:Glycosyltransferase family protein 64 C3 [Nymphaea thermarum]|nr:Glycosyltransferase family protein 64 C3 [Nymphaea thermarum]
MGTKKKTQPVPFFFFIVTIYLLQTKVASRPVLLSHQEDPCRPIDHKSLRSDQLTVLINGFSESRLMLLQEIATVYSSSPAVHSVYVLWGNPSTASETLRNISFQSLGAPIFLFRDASPSLNNRFLPRLFIRTRAVAVCDDDVRIDSDSLRFAFRVWQNHPERIVGFFARSHEFDLSRRSWMYTVSSTRFSIILTKFMVVSIDYLFEYTCRIPASVREIVDKRRNCEDIAMNFAVAARVAAGPILVEGKARDYGDSRNWGKKQKGGGNGGGGGIDRAEGGLSWRGNHRRDRGDCITEFHKAWGRMPLRYSYGRVVDGIEEQGLCKKGKKLVPCDEQE